MIVLLEKEGYKFIENRSIDLNSISDYHLQKLNPRTKKWKNEYLFHNKIQCILAMEDMKYTKWLCGDTACDNDVVISPYR